MATCRLASRLFVRRLTTPVRRESNPIAAEIRLTGSSAAKKIRDDSKVPCVVASTGENNYMHIAVDHEHLVKEANKEGFFTSLLDLEVQQQSGGADVVRVLPQRVQVHPLTNSIRHAWFLQHKPGARVRVKLPIAVSGREKSPGLRLGGWLMTIRHEIECECDIDDIPTKVDVDVELLGLEECLRMGAIDWEKVGCRPVKWNEHDPIVKVSGSRGARAAAKAAA